MTSEQITIWTGEFGRAYTERNRFSDVQEFNLFYSVRYGRSRDDINRDWLEFLPKDARILEIGANVGNQLEALRRIGFSQLYGLEVQRYCVREAKRIHPEVDIFEGSAFDIPFKDGFFDLVFTNNVLIHIAPPDLSAVQREAVRVCRGFVLGFEYFAPEFTEINYRGNQNLLWKADYSRLYQEACPELVLEREQIFPCLDEPGNEDKLFLLRKAG